MEARGPPARARKLGLMLEGLTDEVRSLRSQTRALMATPPEPKADERELAAQLLAQLELLDRHCALLAEQLELLFPGTSPPPPSRGGDR